MLVEEILEVKDVLNETKNGMRDSQDALNLAFVKHDKIGSIINKMICSLKLKKIGMRYIKENTMIVKTRFAQLKHVDSEKRFA